MAISKVTSGGIADGTLSVEDIKDDAVTAAKLANSINTDIATGVTGNTTANAALPKAGGAMTGAITTNSTFDGVDIATRDAILTSTTTTAAAALPKAGGTMTGNLNITKASASAIVTSTGSGNDASVLFATPSNARGMYLDDSDSNKLKFYTGHGKGAAGKEITFDNDGNVLMGTLVTGRSNEGAHRLTIADSGHSGLTIRSGTGSYGSINFSDSEGGTGEYAGSIWYGHGGLGEKLVIAIEGSNRLTVDGDGIKFNNDSAAANALNDYEEGTWTPTLTEGTNTNASYDNRSGNYVKIGRTVFVEARINITSLGSISGNLRLAGLPFNVSNTVGSRATMNSGWGVGLNITAGQHISGYANGTTDYFWLTVWASASGTAMLTDSTLSADGGFMMSATYTTDS